jgi:hypothetical protein
VRTILGHAAAALAGLAATLVFLLPSIGDVQRSLGPDFGDPLLNLYFLEWGAHQVSQGLPDPWSPPFFYPTPRVLTLSDHLLGPAVPFLALRRLGLTGPGAYNVLLLASFALGGFTAWWVLRRTGLGPWGALAGGWVFAFNGYRWSAIGHYQVLRMQWIPLVLWTFDRLLERATPGRAAAFLLIYALHVSGGAYLAVLVHFGLAVLLLNRVAHAPRRFLDGWRAWLPAAALAGAVSAVLYGPYLDAGIPLQGRHSMAAVQEGGAVLASFLTPSALGLDARLLPFLPSEAARGALFPGLAAVLLVGFAAGPRLGCLRTASRRARFALGAGLLTGGAALWLGDRVTRAAAAGARLADYAVPFAGGVLGAALVLAALREADVLPADPWRRGLVLVGVTTSLLCLATFAVAWTRVPGLGALRVPTRAFAVALFPIAFAAGVGWERASALAARGRIAGAAAGALLLALVVESLPSLPAWRPIPVTETFPAYARWIAAHDEVHAYLEVPLGKAPHWEAGPMYLQTLHWRPLVNGYSAVLPPSFREIQGLCRPFPDRDGLSRLSALGVTHVVLHRAPPSWPAFPDARARVARFLPAFDDTLRAWGARRVFADDRTEIYGISRDSPP